MTARGLGPAPRRATLGGGMASDPKWKRFEKLAADIERELRPQNAVVTQNEMVFGKTTRTPRQVDIAVRVPVGDDHLFVAIECKDFTTKVDVQDVESFIGKLPDIEANKGVMISSSGFTKAAMRRAGAAAVEVLTLVDVESVDWPARATAPVLVETHYPSVSFALHPTSFIPALNVEDCCSVPLYDSPESPEPIGTPLGLFAHWWNRADLGHGAARGDIPLHPGTVFIKTDRGAAEVRVTAKVRATPVFFLGDVPLVKLRGFAAHAPETGSTTVQTRRFATDWIVFAEVEASWRRFASKEEIAVRPMVELYMSAVSDEAHPERIPLTLAATGGRLPSAPVAGPDEAAESVADIPGVARALKLECGPDDAGTEPDHAEPAGPGGLPGASAAAMSRRLDVWHSGRLPTPRRPLHPLGRTRAELADALGLAPVTLVRWGRPARAAAPGFRPVVVAPEPARCFSRRRRRRAAG